MKQLWKNNRLYIILSVVCLVIGLVIGIFIGVPHIIKKIIITTNQGNVVKISNVNYYLIGITNKITISNVYTLYIDDANYNTDSFVNVQNADKLKVSLWKRSENVNLSQWESQSGALLGGGVGYDASGLIGSVLGGYQWENFGIAGNVFYGSISNFGIIGDAFVRF